MSVIQERICYPIGYAKHLYRMNGKKVTNPCELEMYNNYVVASNYDKGNKPCLIFPLNNKISPTVMVIVFKCFNCV